MSYSEENLLRLLKYENLEISSLLLKISQTLKIQYIEDNGVYTLGSKHFVLDINKQIKIFYVDDTLNEKFQYVEYFLTHFFVNKEFFDFYNHLKFFINFLESEGLQISKIRNSAEICACVNNYDYCDIYDIPIIKREYTFNIFTHRYEFHQFMDQFISVPENLHGKEEINLAECYQPVFLDRTLFKLFSNSYYKGEIDKYKVFIDKDEKIYLNDVYDKKRSFMFKKGLNLLDCVTEIIN